MKALFQLIFLGVILTACSGGGGGGGNSFSGSSNGSSGDSGGSGGSDSFTETPVISVASPADDNQSITLSNETSYTVSGTCVVDGGNITIEIAAASFVQEIECPSSGTYSEDIDFSSIADGSYTLEITQTNSSGAESSISRAIEKISDHCDAAPAGTFQDGDGTTALTAYTICTTAQFNSFITSVGTGEYYKLMDNLDFGNTSPSTGEIGENYFDGNNLTISNVSLSNAALFGSTGFATSSIENLVLDNINLLLTADSGTMGILLRRAEVATVIDNITLRNSSFTKNYNDGSTNFDGMGGLVGNVSNTF